MITEFRITHRCAKGVQAYRRRREVLRRCLLGAVILMGYTACAQTGNWETIIARTRVAVRYFSPEPSATVATLAEISTVENAYSLTKTFSDNRMVVKLTFRKYDSQIELTGEVSPRDTEGSCFTVRVMLPTGQLRNIAWCHDLDSTVNVGGGRGLFSNYVEARTVVPPAGAFNADSTHNGGYGDKVGTGQMSCYPVAAISADGIGLAWGVDMGIPLVYRLAYDPIAGMIAEYDFATAKGTKKFPNRAFFKMHLFECDPVWHLRAALEKYYTMQLEYFQKRVTQEGIWLPFAPLCEIRGWEDFGFAFHETNVHSIDSGLHPPVTTISAGKIANVLTFQYTEPWEEEIPLQHHDPTYEEIAGGGVIPPEHAGYFGTSTALDKANKWIVRKLETPWFSSGWALSVNTNTDPDIMGFNRYDYVSRREIQPALAMDVDGIYFDCLEWHWQYDMNYNAAHFEYTDYPLTFSSSLDMPRPVIWSYASDYEFVKNIADQMHAQGKYVMGNSFCWIPFAAGLLDVFGSELSLYVPGDMALARLKYARSMAHDKPVVFLLNEGLDDALFTRPPYAGYTSYFDRMLLYGFFPSFFSVNATSNIYWADSSRYDQGRPFFRKYIPLIRAISKAGWQPVTFARLHPSTLSIERFGPDGSKTHYFTVYNPTAQQVRAVISIDARALNLTEHVQIAELLEGAQTECTKRGDTVEVVLTVGGNAARLIKVTTE